MSAAVTICCGCGGRLLFGTEAEFGRSIETCAGSCGYSGPPRPDLAPVPPIERAANGFKVCIEPDCHEPTMTQHGSRCVVHNNGRQAWQAARSREKSATSANPHRRAS